MRRYQAASGRTGRQSRGCLYIARSSTDQSPSPAHNSAQLNHCWCVEQTMNSRRTCGTSTPYRLYNEQVCAQLPTSADNVVLLAFAADRRAAIDRYLLAGGPKAANLQQRRAATGWDRRTDRRTDARQLHRPCSAHYASRANMHEEY